MPASIVRTVCLPAVVRPLSQSGRCVRKKRQIRDPVLSGDQRAQQTAFNILFNISKSHVDEPKPKETTAEEGKETTPEEAAAKKQLLVLVTSSRPRIIFMAKVATRILNKYVIIFLLLF